LLEPSEPKSIPEEWLEKRWQFPHCCGALDGKHVAVTCPWNTGSVYRNYKGFFSMVIMALVNADYKFLADLINDEGDGVWSNSEVVGQAWIIVTAGQVS
jgi:hypothetical protein